MKMKSKHRGVIQELGVVVRGYIQGCEVRHDLQIQLQIPFSYFGENLTCQRTTHISFIILLKNNNKILAENR